MSLLPKRDEIPKLNKRASECAIFRGDIQRDCALCRELSTPPRAHHAPNRFKDAVAFACPCAAARRYNRMASALSRATPRPCSNM
jgi:hypothetical protein